MDRFTTTERQRREAFLQQRLREKFLTDAARINDHTPPETFDVDDWLKQQKKAKRPQEGPWGWRGYAHLKEAVTMHIENWLAAGFDVLSFAECDHINEISGDNDENGFRSWDHILESLEQTGVKIYSGEEVYILKYPNKRLAIDFEYQNGATLFTPNAWHYYDVLLETWKRGGEKAEQARQALCSALNTRITLAKVEAEKDFGRAAAVSDDGKRIVVCDVVFVFCGERKWRCYKPEAFVTDKILINPEQYQRRRLDRPPGMTSHRGNLVYLLTILGSKKLPAKVGGIGQEPRLCRQISFKYRERDKRQTLLMTTAAHCPNPLPKGGIEINV